MLRRNPGLAKRDHIDCRVPHRREAGLNPEILRVVQEKSGKIKGSLFVNWIFLRITESAQRDQAVQHSRKDCRQAIAPLPDPPEYPALRVLQRALAHRSKTQRVQDFQHIVNSEKEV